MSQYQTYQSFSLPNQLVRLQTQWAGMKANQVYGTTQGRIFRTHIADWNQYQQNTTFIGKVYFPAPPHFVANEIYATGPDGDRFKYIPGVWAYRNVSEFDVPYVGLVDPGPIGGDLTVWSLYMFSSNWTQEPWKIEIYLMSNVKPMKIEETGR